jgi:hypothetical protein
MAYNVLLISEQKLKDNTPINENVDSSELRFCILQAQNIQIQESLGTNLYEKLLQIVDNGTISDPSNLNYKLLLDNYIQPTLISYSYYLGLDNFWVKFINIGLVQNSSEQGQPVDLKTLQYLKQNAKNQAEFNDNLLRRHLVFKSNLYPEYFGGSLNDGQIFPETDSAFNSSITLGGNNGGYWKRKWGSNFNAMGSLCCGSNLPSWYGSPNNSPGMPKG